MAHLDIYDLQWIDVVFAGRNKEYGAYQLRKDNSRTLNKALIIGSSIFIIGIMSLQFAGRFSKNDKVDVGTIIVLSQPSEIKKKTPPPIAPAEPPKPKADKIKFPPLVAVPAAEVIDVVPTITDLIDADPGQQTIEGDPKAPVIIDAPSGNGSLQATEIVESNAVVSYETVQVIPEFKGGMEKFYQYISKAYRYPAMAQEKGVSGKVYMSFVIEKDGSLTDIKVLRDPGMGTGEEAVRVLKNSPKWSPGIQNGKPIRVSYTLPLSLNLEAQ